jgi:hypothetical protein
METIQLEPNGDLAIRGGTTVRLQGAECARQRAETDLGLFLGEFFLDTSKGVPYYRDVLVKNPNLETIRTVFRSVVRAVPGIVDVPRCDVFPPDSDRHALCEWEAVYQDGGFISSSVPRVRDTYDDTFDDSFPH